jgi:hypothetical protein
MMQVLIALFRGRSIGDSPRLLGHTGECSPLVAKVAEFDLLNNGKNV